MCTCRTQSLEFAMWFSSISDDITHVRNLWVSLAEQPKNCHSRFVTSGRAHSWFHGRAIIYAGTIGVVTNCHAPQNWSRLSKQYHSHSSHPITTHHQKCARNDNRSSTACMKCPEVVQTTLLQPLNSKASAQQPVILVYVGLPEVQQMQLSVRTAICSAVAGLPPPSHLNSIAACMCSHNT